MGIFKIFFMAAVPALTMTVLAFRLGPKLPGAARLFGNQIGLGYVYFKCALKYLKPNDQTAYQMLSVARKASQQSQALRRELKNTLKRARDDIKAKRQELYSELQKNPHGKEIVQQYLADVGEFKTAAPVQTSKAKMDGTSLVASIITTREELLSVKTSKKQANKFFTQL